MASKIKTGLSSPGSLRVPKLTRIMTRSEPNTEKRSPKVPTPPEKTQIRAVKGSESHPRLTQIKDDLRKANEQIASLENDKAKALDDLNEARKEAVEASSKLDEALKAQKKVEESFEIQKFEAVEAGIEAVQRKEEELKKELENVKNQHDSDVTALLLVTQELEKVRQELSEANDAKSKVLSQADYVSKMAAIHEEKVEILSSELIRLKALLDSTREKETISNKEIALKLGGEIVVLKRELENTRRFKVEVKEREMIIDMLKVDLEAVKMAESYAHGSADEWQNKAKELEEQLEEANKLTRSASVSLVSVTKQLEESNDRLHGMESEITDLKVKIGLLETMIARQKEELQESEQRLGITEEELSKIENEAGNLKNELETVKEEKNQTLKKEQEAGSSVQMLLGEKNKILSELKSSMRDWEKREAELVKKFEEVSSMGKEVNRLGNLVKRTKEEADTAWKKESQMRDSLKEVEDEVIYLQETLREARGETLKLNEKMLDKETELQRVVHENDLLRVKHDDSVKKINEFAKKYTEENGELIENGSTVENLDGMNMKLEEDREKKEDSPDGNDDDDDTIEVEDSFMIEKSEKTSPGNKLTREEDQLVKEKKKKKKKKKRLFGKVGNLLKKKSLVNQK